MPIVEYIWIDGTTPTQTLRSKSRVVDNHVELDAPPFTPPPGLKLSDIPEWSFDGSSTNQAEGGDSDLLLKPVKHVSSEQLLGFDMVLCEVMNKDGTPHESNTRHAVADTDDGWRFGFEQEYFMMQDGRILGWPEHGQAAPQGPYYCGVGADEVVGRDLALSHLQVCSRLGLNVTGMNAEVALGQWEFQVDSMGVDAADSLWLCRWLLYMLGERQNVYMTLEPKPVKGAWNGSGMHTNFSNHSMRLGINPAMYEKITDALEITHGLHMENYGHGNDQRMSGEYETSRFDEFSYGKADRGCSIRMPPAGTYLEDRRPAANADPYRVIEQITTTLGLLFEPTEV